MKIFPQNICGKFSCNSPAEYSLWPSELVVLGLPPPSSRWCRQLYLFKMLASFPGPKRKLGPFSSSSLDLGMKLLLHLLYGQANRLREWLPSCSCTSIPGSWQDLTFLSKFDKGVINFFTCKWWIFVLLTGSQDQVPWYDESAHLRCGPVHGTEDSLVAEGRMEESRGEWWTRARKK